MGKTPDSRLGENVVCGSEWNQLNKLYEQISDSFAVNFFSHTFP